MLKLGMRRVSCFLRPLSSWCYLWSTDAKKSLDKSLTIPSKSTKPSSTHDYFNWLNTLGPCYPIRGEDVVVLTEPTQFYEVLKLKSKKAKKRIVLASLYLGTDSLEDDLVESIHDACAQAQKDKNQDFKVQILLDYTRGSRGKTSSRTMLTPLLSEYENNVQVALYHTPDLRGLLKKVIPERFNETIGLTHIKAYVFDDSVIISGANLSDNYFTNRQDRYILFNNCTDLADFFDKLIHTVSKFSFQLKADNSVSLHPDWSLHPYKGSSDVEFKNEAKKQILGLLDDKQICTKEHLKNSGNISSQNNHRKRAAILKKLKLLNNNVSDVDQTGEKPCDTWVYPLLQMGPLGIIYDECATLHLFREAGKGDEILLASGYFNLTDYYKSVILHESTAKYNILMASPEVNGFYGAKGIAGYIPYAYVHIARQFYTKLKKYEETQRIQLAEYYRHDWTFHVKGLWYYLPNETLPSLTLVGSPNFGYRSVYRDLECQTAIVTDNNNLRQQLRQEHVRLYQFSSPIKPDWLNRRDRQVPTWTKLVTAIIKNFF